MPQRIYSKSPYRANGGGAARDESSREGASTTTIRSQGSFRRRPSATRALLAGALLLAAALLLASCSARSAQSGRGSAAGASASSRAASQPPSRRGAGPRLPNAQLPLAARTASQAGQPPAASSSPGQAPAEPRPSSPPRAPAAEPARPTEAYVSYVTGNVSAAAGAGEAVTQPGGPPAAGGAVRVADPVRTGELLATDGNSLAQVRIGPGVDVSLGHDTLVRFDEIGRSGSATPHRVVLSLRRGSLIVKSGAAGAPLLLEIHTPHLFLSSRGGTMLVTDSGVALRAAVGLGEAWLLPESVVYPQIIGKVAKPAVRLLNGILAKAVPLRRDSEVTVLPASLDPVDQVGSAILALLDANLGKAQLAKPAMEALTGLTRKAAVGVAEAIGKPVPLSLALRRELDPASIPKRRMKVTSSSESSSASGSSGGGSSSGGGASGAKGGGAQAGSPWADVWTGPGSASGASTAAVPSSSGSLAASGASGSTASGAGSAGSGASGAVSSGAGSPSSGSTADGFPGPIAPTPPTPPAVPK